jgi:hypothetical protein
MDKKTPDRIMIVVQTIVFSIFTCFILFLIFVVFMESWFNSLGEAGTTVVITIPIVSLFLNILAANIKWKRLNKRELYRGHIELSENNNLTTRQVLFSLFGVLILLVGTILFTLFTKIGGIACFILFGLVWVYDAHYYGNR